MSKVLLHFGHARQSWRGRVATPIVPVMSNDLFAGPPRTQPAYDASSIEVLEGLEPVRRRPGMYIGGTDERALHHLAAEVLDELIRESLSRGGPVTVADVEARLALLQEKGLLLGDGDRVVTTQGSVRLEQAYLATVEAGRGQSAPIVPSVDAAIRVQEVARELGLHRLNAGQEAAAVLMLSSSDRVVNVQGGSGRGKSTAMAPVTAVATAEGRAVIGLAIASVKASEFGRDTGADVSTVARFLARHARATTRIRASACVRCRAR